MLRISRQQRNDLAQKLSDFIALYGIKPFAAGLEKEKEKAVQEQRKLLFRSLEELFKVICAQKSDDLLQAVVTQLRKIVVAAHIIGRWDTVDLADVTDAAIHAAGAANARAGKQPASRALYHAVRHYGAPLWRQHPNWGGNQIANRIISDVNRELKSAGYKEVGLSAIAKRANKLRTIGPVIQR